MNKIYHVALTEFLATVATKGFIIGIVITPIIILVAIYGMGTLLNEKAPPIVGEVAIVDPTRELFAGISAYLQPEAIARRRGDLKELADIEVPPQIELGQSDATRVALDAVLGEVPQLDVVGLDVHTDLEVAKAPLREGDTQSGGRLALVVIHDDAIVKPEGQQGFGSYDLFVKDKLDDRIESEIHAAITTTMRGARVRAAGLDPKAIGALTRIGRVTSRIVSEEGEKDTNRMLNALMPISFMLLLFVSVLSGGQYLMTTTIEDKSSRVVEVLLSAVSPMQLMTGKIIGQMAVGFVILGAYAGMGIGTLVAFSLVGMLDMSLIFYLIIFYFIAFSVMASLMAAIGAAVNEMREAQTLMTPVMLAMMIPWILWLPISRDPNSTFAVVTSFLPPINTFVMLLRMTSTSPPPQWQVWLSILIGVASVYVAVWIAAKVFRIGILMFGKPPNFRTLLRWVRMA
jgi:ABC-type Na+ efflux pump permease subunit|tara:strand:+ start:2456 stop:3829 length:1374 start_codon:yes stop_codon:yes gene_type:complete